MAQEVLSMTEGQSTGQTCIQRPANRDVLLTIWSSRSSRRPPEPIAGPSQPGPKTYTAQNGARPQGRRNDQRNAGAQQVGRTAHGNEDASQAGQRRRPGHRDAEDGIASHESDYRQPVKGDNGRVQADRINYRR